MPHNEQAPSLLDATNPAELARAKLFQAGASYDEDDAVEREFGIQNLARFISSKVSEGTHRRHAVEARWFKNVQSFKMLDNAGDALRNDSEVSDVYLRTTTVKTRAAFAQITESVLNDSRFPIEISASRVPDGASEFAHLGQDGGAQGAEAAGIDAAPDSQADFGLMDPSGIGFAGDGRELAAGATIENLSFLGGMEEELGSVGLVEGPARMGEAQIQPAKEAARKMDKLIQDQLASTQARTAARKTIFEMCLLGVGALKGPFNVTTTMPNWVTGEDGKREYKPVKKTSPQLSFVSMWNLHVDPNADCIEDAEWVAEKHRMTHHKLMDLKNRPLFDAEAIDRLAAKGPNYTESDFESQLRTEKQDAPESSLWEVWEYWGYMPVDRVREHGVEVPEDAEDVVQVNVWYSGDEVIRLSMNPFLPARIPYYVIPYEEKPYQLEGVGVPEAMEDAQKMINGFARLAVENAALAGNLVFDIDESSLVQGQDMTVYPGKIFKRMAGTQGNAINAIKFPNTANENLQMMQEFRRHADEATGIPSLAHGQAGVSGFGRTSSGMSMILNNASLNIKTVVRNLDDHLFKPLGTAYFNWNMQYRSEDMPEIVGDLEVHAKGVQSLEQKEVRAQRISTFLQLAASPSIAPLIKIPTIIKELAIANDIEPEEILNSPEEAEIYAKLIGSQGGPAGAGTPAAAPAAAPGASMPGSPGFTGNDQSSGNPLGVNSSEGV